MSVAEEYGFDFSSEPCESFPFSRYPCRKCLPCLKRRQQEWVTRLCEELRQHDNNFFVTLTYEDSYVPADTDGQMCFDNARIIKLHRDLRKRYQQGFFRNPYSMVPGFPETFPLPKDQKIRYYVTGEYCPTSTQRPHYHAVYYNMGVDLYTADLLFQSLWPDGFIKVLEAGEAAAGYISKYLVKDNLVVDSYHDDTRMSPIAIMSKGLGKSYIDRMKDFHLADPDSRRAFQYHGEKRYLSRYYRGKIFSDEQREDWYHDYSAESGALKDKYNIFRQEHPLLYTRLLEERKKYFDDQRTSARWEILKKQKSNQNY